MLLPASPSASPSPSPSPSASPGPASYRAVVLACRGSRVAIAGGGILALADGATCAGTAPGRAYVLDLDAAGHVTTIYIMKGGTAIGPATAIPALAFVVKPPVSAAPAAGELVDCVIDVYVPPRTPATDDVYISTERSGWQPAEVRMNRVDARHYSVTLSLARGSTVGFRVSRGSYATLERDVSRSVPPPHLLHVATGARARVDVAAWADID